MPNITSISQTQKIIVNPANKSISVTLAGPMGPAGPPGVAGLTMIPIGAVIDYVGVSAPASFRLLDGSTIINGQNVYPNLWAIIPTTWKSGANIVLPEAQGRATIGAGAGTGLTARTLAATGGAETHLLTGSESGTSVHTHVQNAHNHVQDAHNHTQNAHNHTQNSHNHTQDSHNHTQNAHSHSVGGTNEVMYRDSAYNTGQTSSTSGLIALNYQTLANATATNIAATATNQAATATNIATTPTNIAATATNQAATATNIDTTAANAVSAHNNMQPFLVLNKIIRCE